MDSASDATELRQWAVQLLGTDLQVEETLVAHSYRWVCRARLEGSLVLIKAFTEPWRADAEITAMRAARNGGVGVPPLLEERRTPHRVLVILGWVEGVPLGSQPEGWTRAGELLARLHGLPVSPGLPTVSGWKDDWSCDLIRQVPTESDRAVRFGLLSDAESQRMVTRLGADLRASVPTATAFLHGDLQPDHVILTPNGGVTFIDWGDSGTGDPLWDIAVLVNDEMRHLEDVIAGYRPEPALRARLRDHLDALRALRYLQEATWLAERSFDPSRAVTGLLELIS